MSFDLRKLLNPLNGSIGVRLSATLVAKALLPMLTITYVVLTAVHVYAVRGTAK